MVIYAADVKNVSATLDIGSLIYNPGKVMMADYNGNEIYKKLSEKVKAAQELTDVDMLNLIFLPLMSNTIPRNELAVNSVKLAQTIQDTNKRNACLAASFAFASKYLKENELENLEEALNMRNILAEYIEEGIQEGMQEGIQQGIKQGMQQGRQEGMQQGRQEREVEIAKNMLKDNEPIEKIVRYVRLDESTIIRLKTNLNNE